MKRSIALETMSKAWVSGVGAVAQALLFLHSLRVQNKTSFKPCTPCLVEVGLPGSRPRLFCQLSSHHYHTGTFHSHGCWYHSVNSDVPFVLWPEWSSDVGQKMYPASCTEGIAWRVSISESQCYAVQALR